MQFSILGVPFKCTKDMFAWEKFKWSLCVYWSQWWRAGLFSVGMLILWAGVIFFPAVVNTGVLPGHEEAELSMKLSVYIARSFFYWKDNLVLASVLLGAWLISLIVIAWYIQYYATFRKNYKSFDRHFFKPQVEKFWSWGFWKPSILTLVVSVLLGLAVGFVLGWFDIMDIVISLIGFIVGLVLFHIFLHGGSWGFILTPKQITLLTKGKE